MLPTFEAYYHDGKIDLKELPQGVKEARVLITFLDVKNEDDFPIINWDNLNESASKIDKWVGILESFEVKDVKTSRKEYIEKKHQ